MTFVHCKPKSEYFAIIRFVIYLFCCSVAELDVDNIMALFALEIPPYLPLAHLSRFI